MPYLHSTMIFLNVMDILIVLQLITYVCLLDQSKNQLIASMSLNRN